jgi:hypothetical protein
MECKAKIVSAHARKAFRHNNVYLHVMLISASEGGTCLASYGHFTPENLRWVDSRAVLDILEKKGDR